MFLGISISDLLIDAPACVKLKCMQAFCLFPPCAQSCYYEVKFLHHCNALDVAIDVIMIIITIDIVINCDRLHHHHHHHQNRMKIARLQANICPLLAVAMILIMIIIMMIIIIVIIITIVIIILNVIITIIIIIIK